MDKSSKYKKIIILLSLTAFLVFVSYYFLYNELLKKNDKLAHNMDYISSESSREVYVYSVKRQFQNLDPDIKKIKNSIISPTGAVAFIGELETMARNNGLSIQNDSIIEETDSKVSSSSLSFLKIRSTTEGSWSGTYKFISEIESMPYKVKINYVTLTTTEDNKDKKGEKKVWNNVFEIRLLKYK